MFSNILILLCVLFPLAVSTDQFWVTTVLTELKVRDQCADFWSQSQACPSPLIRVSTNINRPTQFASRAWPVLDLVNSTEKPSFVSQWHGSVDTIRVSAQIEGSNPLNPFGLIAKCDEGFHPRVVFNQSSDHVMERLSTRVIVIQSQCFTAKVLLKIDTVCPYCPTTTTQAPTTLSPESLSSLIYKNRLSIVVFLALIIITILSITVFFCTLRRFLRLRNGFKTFPSLESGISTITPQTESTITSIEKKNEIVDFFSLMPPVIDYDDLDFETSIDINALPRLGSLVYSFYESKQNVSVSEPVFV